MATGSSTKICIYIQSRTSDLTVTGVVVTGFKYQDLYIHTE